ncbi:hypothetical protein CJF31_00005967 [Rutstroemia sp. NJR-2017a BVV2]|nr:hypothetical protein CJF31_00005967 [Rutstroemia sp. NJR-2017a BVV2]
MSSTHHTSVLTPVPAHIPRPRILSLLHDHTRMITLNPLVTAHHLLSSDASSKISLDFFRQEAKDLWPSDAYPGCTDIWEITDDMGSAKNGESSGWRGSWASKFIPEKITYNSSLQDREDGMVSVTHAPMGVHSVTSWVVREVEGEGEKKWVLEERGEVRASRFLMGFIKTTLQESHQKLVRDFMAVLEEEARGGEQAKGSGKENEVGGKVGEEL